MTRFRPLRRRGLPIGGSGAPAPPGLPIGGSAPAATLAVLALTVSGSANAHNTHDRAVPPPPAVPTSADQIQNIDQVKTAIKGYYGDTTTTQADPVDTPVDGGDKALHQSSQARPYATEMAGPVSDAEKYLNNPPGSGTGKKFSGTKA